MTLNTNVPGNNSLSDAADTDFNVEAVVPPYVFRNPESLPILSRACLGERNVRVGHRPMLVLSGAETMPRRLALSVVVVQARNVKHNTAHIRAITSLTMQLPTLGAVSPVMLPTAESPATAALDTIDAKRGGWRLGAKSSEKSGAFQENEPSSPESWGMTGFSVVDREESWMYHVLEAFYCAPVRSDKVLPTVRRVLGRPQLKLFWREYGATEG